MGQIEGVRESIKYEVGDIVWVYWIAESYRYLHPEINFDRNKCIITKVSESDDGKHFDQYAVKNIETGETGAWYYPTFLEPFEK